ncbi:MAG: NUDIX domain-containing protein [Clostridia bacterium]|nr:NUDIX domain-containing protein [Clostridia bacterium]
MIIIAGCVIVRDNKVLMVKEAQKKCYGQWNYPAGHVDEGETITTAAIREVLEETGCKVKLTGVLPIYSANGGDIERLMVRFTAEIIEENIKIDPEEILDVQWIDVEQIKNMTREELRAYDVNMQYLKDFEDGKIYPLEIFNDTQFFE